MVNKDIDYILHEEVNIGNRAQQAYDVYIKDYFDNFQSSIAKQLYANDLTADDILAIRHQITAIKALEEIILRDIETGQLAFKQLSEE
tara:strand:+ start:2039 stop:2302 length:264 start_codon:yes stop_codon:yes gene_type:complete